MKNAIFFANQTHLIAVVASGLFTVLDAVPEENIRNTEVHYVTAKGDRVCWHHVAVDTWEKISSENKYLWELEGRSHGFPSADAYGDTLPPPLPEIELP